MVTYHVVNATEDAVAALPLAYYARIVLCFMSGEVLLAREAAAGGLSASGIATEERLGVSLVVLPEIASSSEHGARSAARISATPCPFWVHEAVEVEVRMSR